MKELNLVDPKKTEIFFEVSKFPDGQKQVKIISWFSRDGLKYGQFPITIKSRLNNFSDLELIICAVQSLRNLGVTEIHLYTPYFLGSRSDRQFESGSNNYLKQVICPLINGLNFQSVTVVDPHSDVLEACLNNFTRVDNFKFVKWALENINNKPDAQLNTVFVSPDAGALKKIYKIADYVCFGGDIVTCSKERDKEGALTKCIAPIEEHQLEKDAIIIDDIIDAGGTFINIAKELKQNCWKGGIFLISTHGIFSKGLGELQQYFDGIYCTNSYQDLQDCESFVKQLNIF